MVFVQEATMLQVGGWGAVVVMVVVYLVGTTKPLTVPGVWLHGPCFTFSVTCV